MMRRVSGSHSTWRCSTMSPNRRPPVGSDGTRLYEDWAGKDAVAVALLCGRHVAHATIANSFVIRLRFHRSSRQVKADRSSAEQHNGGSRGDVNVVDGRQTPQSVGAARRSNARQCLSACCWTCSESLSKPETLQTCLTPTCATAAVAPAVEPHRTPGQETGGYALVWSGCRTARTAGLQLYSGSPFAMALAAIKVSHARGAALGRYQANLRPCVVPRSC
jgi:hypothetical protein